MPSTDPVATLYNAQVSLLGDDPDFSIILLPAISRKDDQDGWLAQYLQSTPNSYPQFRFTLGDGIDYGMLKDTALSLETVEPVTEWYGKLEQTFNAEFIFDTNQHDSMLKRRYEFAFKRAIDRKGPFMGIQGVCAPPGPFTTRRGEMRDVNQIMRPYSRISYAVSYEYNGSTVL